MREEIHVQTDTIDLRLVRLRPVTGPPVVYVPGLGANPRSVDLVATPNLAEALHTSGHTPWAVDFRIAWRRGGMCSLSLLRALELALVELEDHSGHRAHRFGAIGHSLGGILLLGIAARGVPLKRLITLGTGLDYRLGHVDLKHLLRFMKIRGRLRRASQGLGGFPLRRPARVLAPLFGRGVNLPLQVDQFHPGATQGSVIRRFFREGVADVPFPLLLDLTGLFREEGLRFGDGAALKDQVRRLDVPVMLVAGRQDRQCPVDSVRDAADRIPGSALVEVGTSEPGLGYGHMDLLLGRHAGRDVFPPILQFLE